jgi:hypothetical protein
MVYMGSKIFFGSLCTPEISIIMWTNKVMWFVVNFFGVKIVNIC